MNLLSPRFPNVADLRLTSCWRFLSLALLLSFSAQASAQTGSIRVDVIDAVTGRPLAESAVKVTSRSGSLTESVTRDQGVANLDELDPGRYEVMVSKDGYLAARFSEIRVSENKTALVKVELTASSSEFEEIVVQGRATDVNALGSAGAGFLDRESLRSAAGSGGDVLRALDAMPGLFSSGEFSSFTVRGNGPRDNLILVDGIPFDHVVHFSESFGELEEIEGGGRYSVFAPNLISGAEFQPGGWGAAYGGRAGSLLSLEVAEGNPETASYTARLDIAGLEVGYEGPSRFHDNTSLLFSARQLDFGRLFEFIGMDDAGSPKLTDIIFKSSTDFANDSVDFLFVYAPEEYGRTVENALASDEDEPGVFEDLELADGEIDNTLAAITWSKLLGDNAEWVNAFYYRNYDEAGTTGEAYADLVPLGTPASEVPAREEIVTSARKETEIGWRSDYSVYNGFGRFSAGARVSQLDLDFSLALDDDWIRYIYDQSDSRDMDEQRYVVLTPESFDTSYVEKSSSYALYMEQGFELGDWDFRFGGRYDRDSLAEENLFSPRFGSYWQMTPRTRLSATAGIYYQAPTLEDRASDEGNNSLENEQINQFSIGVRHQFSDNLEFMFETYYQDLDNLVVDLDLVNQTSSNTGSGRSFGFDTALTKRFSNGWSADIGYSYNDAQVKDADGLELYDADFSRPHSVGLGGVWEINDRWKLSARWKYASGTPKDEFVVYENVLGDAEPLRYSKENITTNTERFDSYSSLNFRADYRRPIGAADLIMFIDVINLLGSENTTTTEFNERTGLDALEEGESIPLFGFRLEW